MSDPWTVRRVVSWMSEDLARRGIASPRLDAELLVADALGLDRLRLFLDLDRPLDDAEREAIRARHQRRRGREPVAYILGHREFWGRRFRVSPTVLVPRPDTETLIERALELLPADAEGPLLDACTGSGAIGLTLAAERPSLEVHLTDLSPEALDIARANAAALEVEGRVRFFEGDLFAALPSGVSYPMVTINPPYVAEADRASLEPELTEHEPAMALFAGADGFDVLTRIVRGLGGVLAPGGVALIEVGEGQAPRVAEQFEALDWVARVERHEDLGKIERVVEVARRDLLS